MSFPSFGDVIDWINPWHHDAPAGTASAAPPAASSAPAVADPATAALAPEPKLPGADLVYLGINDSARPGEMKALPPGSTAIDGAENADKDPTKQGTFKDKDGKDIKLDSQANVDLFLQQAGVGAARVKADGSQETKEEVQARMDALEQVFLGKKVNGKYSDGAGMAMSSRDEMAELIAHAQKVQNGDAEMKRLIISGHHYEYEPGIHGDRGQMGFAELGAVFNQFDKARDGVEDLMFSACNTSNGYQAPIYQKLFPHLKSFMGYNTYAPSVGDDPLNSSTAHIRDFGTSSQGGDPEAIKRMFPDRKGPNGEPERAGARVHIY